MMKIKFNWQNLKSKISSSYTYLKTEGSEILDFLYAHYFIMNIAFVILVFLLIMFDFEGIREVQELDGFSEKQGKFVFYTFFLGAFLLLVQVIKLLAFEVKVKKYKETLTKEGYRKFLEYEYKKNDQNFFTGLPYIMTFFISISAIYVSLIGMQVSVDIVSSTKTGSGEVLLHGTKEMFNSFGAWSGTIFAVFIGYFFGYKFNQLSKRDVLERLYYGEYKKSK